LPDGNVANRDLSLSLNILMRGITAGGVVTSCAVADVKVLIAATVTGVGPTRLPAVQNVSASLVSFCQQPITQIDTIGEWDGTTLFGASPVLSVERVGSTVHLILSTFAPADVTNYGATTAVQTYITGQAFCKTNNNNTSAKWVEFI
jgi:hypothetical protein